MTAADTRTVEVAGRPVRIRIDGPQDGPPVLLLHGIGRSLEDWVSAHDLLAGRHRVISADLPGFGLTRRQAERPGLSAFARAMVGVLDAAGVPGPVTVMGNSLGGAVAMTMAVEHRSRVAALVLVNAAGFGREVRISPFPMVLGVLSALPGIGPRFVARAREAGAQVNRDLFWDPAFATPEMIRHAGRVGRQPDFLGTFLTTARELGRPLYGAAPGWRRRLLTELGRRPELPVLVVWGEQDAILPAAHLEAAARALPHARTHLFEETGHMPQIERAGEFADLAAEFVAAAVVR